VEQPDKWRESRVQSAATYKIYSTKAKGVDDMTKKFDQINISA
jgi:hypothetical protein